MMKTLQKMIDKREALDARLQEFMARKNNLYDGEVTLSNEELDELLELIQTLRYAPRCSTCNEPISRECERCKHQWSS